jgi:hypothetical protein
MDSLGRSRQLDYFCEEAARVYLIGSSSQQVKQQGLSWKWLKVITFRGSRILDLGESSLSMVTFRKQVSYI